MSYRNALRWRLSGRDRLAVVVVALAVAFLVGTALAAVSAGAAVTGVAAEYGTNATVTSHDSVGAAERAAGPDAVVLPLARVTGPDGTTRTVLARPATSVGLGLARDSPASEADKSPVATLGTVRQSQQLALDGRTETVAVRVRERPDAGVPGAWFVADRATVERLGPTAALAIRDERNGATAGDAGDAGTPLRGALAYFAAGTASLVRALGLVAGVSALLVGVVVHAVTRMAVRDRLQTIRVVRATGGRRRTLLAALAVRGAVVAGAGVALGYALGVIGVNAAVTGGVAVGLSTSLSPVFTPAVGRLLAPALLGLVAVGAVGGALAAWPAVRGSPAAVAPSAAAPSAAAPDSEEGATGVLADWLRPTLLPVRTVVPAAATLVAFVAVVGLVAGAAGVAAPLAATDGGTVAEPGAVHPIASTVPAATADRLRADGVAASPEILAFTTVDGRPVLVRGANYTAFQGLADATLVAGREPDTPREAMLGADLARTLDVGVGETLTVGGSTRSALARVEVAGTYAAPGPMDDQVVVGLPVARTLTNKPDGTVQFVRTEQLPATPSGGAVQVLGVSAPRRVAPNESVRVRATVRNLGSARATRTVSLRIGERRVERTVALDGGRSTRITVPVQAPADEGTYDLRVGDERRRIRVAGPDALVFGPTPARGPPNATMRVGLRRLDGGTVAGATVTLRRTNGTTGGEGGDGTVVDRTTTDADGRAALSLGAPGTYELRARVGDRTTRTTLAVARDAGRPLAAALRVRPGRPSPLVRPTARVVLVNPWNGTRGARVAVASGEWTTRTTARLESGERRTVERSLPRRPPGTYDVQVHTNGTQRDTETYRVTGDGRIAAALASGGYEGRSGLGRGVATALGNLRLVVGVVVALAGAMTVGGTAAAFARAVQGRRRTLGVYRATGAGPGRVAGIVVADALRLAVPATVVGLVGGLGLLVVLARTDQLVAFGVRLPPIPGPTVLAGTALASVGLTVLGAAVALSTVLQTSPAALLGGGGE